VDQEARRLTHLVENILQFSRAERQAIRLAPVPAELATQVREAVEAFTPVARARHVVVKTTLENDVVCVVDPAALRQILLNLLDNAVKFGPLGQTVEITLRRSGDHALIMVDDQGPGIPREHRARIWEPYQRLESAVTAAVAGSGIGLAVVSQLVALHGGRAWTETAPGRGARFVIELRRQPGGCPPEAGGGNGESKSAGSSKPSAAIPDSRLPIPETQLSRDK
jgi:signal transduction histidine kinase